MELYFILNTGAKSINLSMQVSLHGLKITTSALPLVKNDFLLSMKTLCLSLHALLWPHIIAFGGFALALLIVARLFSERRAPSNTLAWSFVILFAPYIGVPLYFLFGGRKSRRLVAHKKAVRSLAQHVYTHPDYAQTPPIWKNYTTTEQGNSFKLLPDGTESFKYLLKEISEAQESIAIATYILGKDHIGQRLIEALIARAKEGIQVQLMIDALGSMGISKRFLAPLIEAGGQVARFMPMLPIHTQTSSNLRNHRKIAIFDHKRAIVGGQNLDQRFMGTQNQPASFSDFSALIVGPAVAELNRIFISDWCFASKTMPEKFQESLRMLPSPLGNEKIRVISSGPDVEGDPLWESLITLIQDAKKSITIVTPYFLPDEVLFQSLLIKARTGRKVTIILPEKSNHALVDVARQHFLRRLKEAGAEIWLYGPKMLHAKLFLVDKHLAMMGSANFDLRSLFVNFEVGIFLSSENALSCLHHWTDELMQHCKPYTPTTPSASRRWLEDIAHILVPLL